MKLVLILAAPLLMSATNAPREYAAPPCYFGLFVQPEQVNPNEQPQRRVRRMTNGIV